MIEEGVDRRLTNNSQIQAFRMKEKEVWRKFCGLCQSERPYHDEAAKIHMCTRWHIKGYCFSDCNNASSHVEKEKVPAEKEKEFGAWMKKVRAAK